MKYCRVTNIELLKYANIMAHFNKNNETITPSNLKSRLTDCCVNYTKSQRTEGAHRSDAIGE